MILYSNGKCNVKYDRVKLNRWEEMKQELFGSDSLRKVRAVFGCAGTKDRDEAGFLRNHSCKEYAARLEAAKDTLDSTYLHDLHLKQNQKNGKAGEQLHTSVK